MNGGTKYMEDSTIYVGLTFEVHQSQLRYFLEIPLPSKSRRIFQPAHPNNHCPRNLPTWYGVANNLRMRTCIQISLLSKLCMCVRVNLCRCRPRNLAALELSPHGTAL